MNKQTILGAGGSIGIELAKILPEYTNAIRLVSRSPKKVNPDDELVSADLNDLSAVRKAVEGSDIVYLTVGLPYRAKIWEKQWPRIMENVIRACIEQGARLVFFDNIYMYGRVDGTITEATPVSPDSKKGAVRARIAQMLITAWENQELQGAIARCPDFYGPGAPNSVFKLMILDKFRNGKSGMWFMSDRRQYRMAFAPDAARATALIGNTESAWNQIWHLPTSSEQVTVRDLIDMAAKIRGINPRYTVLKKWMLAISGWFSPDIRDMREMMYQYEYDYLFDSSKFEEHFRFEPRSYREGITETLNA